jgi:hypothetical protein
VARRQKLDDGRQSYLVYAGAQLVGRMYRCHGVQELWFWGVNAVTLDATVAQSMHGFADDLAEAKEKLRTAFDSWMEWALAMPPGDMKYQRISAELKKMDVG